MSGLTKDVVAKYKLNLVKGDCCREDAARIDFAIEYIDELLAALKKYGRHIKTCQAVQKSRGLCAIAEKAKNESDEYLNVGIEMIKIHEEFADIVRAQESGAHVLKKLSDLQIRSNKCDKIRKKDFLKLNDKEFNTVLERDRLAQEIATLQFRISLRQKRTNEEKGNG